MKYIFVVGGMFLINVFSQEISNVSFLGCEKPKGKIVLKINLSEKGQIKNVSYSKFDNENLVLVFSKILNNMKEDLNNYNISLSMKSNDFYLSIY
ncbi:hypothetical protein HX001_05555 [Empedobacter brevis]|uniref:Uncharacterized protein n=1 Tax=Empedobacter brevis TaxID=247 RepID=A0AAJ1V8J6_9FLAO|nr:hypothetical protein [Empedobacter brevis]MDM1071960.1 hypothetical protein [Empedobacter brevis]